MVGIQAISAASANRDGFVISDGVNSLIRRDDAGGVVQAQSALRGSGERGPWRRRAARMIGLRGAEGS